MIVIVSLAITFYNYDLDKFTIHTVRKYKSIVADYISIMVTSNLEFDRIRSMI